MRNCWFRLCWAAVGAATVGMGICAPDACAQPASEPAPQPVPMPIASPWSAVPPAAATRPAVEDHLTARSLAHGANGLIYLSKPVAQAPRMLALGQMAYRMDPDDPVILQLMADMYQSQSKGKSAAAVLQRLLALYPDSYGLGTRWLENALSGLDIAPAKLAMLDVVADDAAVPAAVRAYACYRQSTLYQGDGQKKEAMDKVLRTLELDRWNVYALREEFLNRSNPGSADVVAYCLNVLSGNPRSVESAWKLAQVSGAMGLYESSVNFFTYVNLLMQFRGRDDAGKWSQFYAEYFNSLLDLLQSKRDAAGEKKLEPQIEQACKAFPLSIDLKSLWIEDCIAIGQKAKADQIAQSMKAVYEERAKSSVMTGDLASEIAWFHLVMMPDPKAAMKYAQDAFKVNDKSPVVNRILGVAELLSDDPDLQKQGEKRLRTLLKYESFAGVFLAEYYDRQGNPDGVAGAVDACASRGRSGPAFRRLQDLRFRIEARDKKAPALPEIADLAKVEALFNQYDDRVLKVLTEPGKALEITIKPVKDQFLPGEPIEVEAVLKNVGAVPLPLGSPGLFNPVMEIVVRAGGEAGPAFANVPVFSWQAPRYLNASQTLRSRIRLDVGALGHYLADRPFEEIPLTIQGVLDGEVRGDARGQALVSSVPTMKIEPATLTRSNLLTLADEFKPNVPASWAPAYKTVLGLIAQKQIVRGDLAQRMRAAAQVNSLLAAARHAEIGDIKLPPSLAWAVQKPAIQSMMKELIQDKSAAVRAEALASLPDAPMDQMTITLLSVLIDDPSPAVRLRVLDALGTAELKGKERLLDRYSKDADEIIQALAKVLAK